MRLGGIHLFCIITFTLSLFSPGLAAQSYPNRPIKLVVPVAPGGGVDIFARTLGARLSEQMGVPVVVENKGGAAAVIGSEFVANAAPDGYTILMGYSSHATNPLFFKRMPYDSIKDFTAIALAGYSPLVLVIHPKAPAQTPLELIDQAKQAPGKLDFASGGRGGGPFMAGLLLQYLAKIDIVHVPYPGNAPGQLAVQSGLVTMMFDTINTAVPQVNAGRLKALAVTSPQRSPLLPQIPTMIELGIPEFEVNAWFLVLAPANLPTTISQRLNFEVNQALKHPAMSARLAADGVVIGGGSQQDASAFLQNEIARWRKVVTSANLKDE
jgi:hypothetical protein